MREIIVLGIGVGHPGHLTLEAVEALGTLDFAIVPTKGEEKADLAGFRQGLLSRHAPQARIESLEMPRRDPAITDYRERVDDWHDAIAERYSGLIEAAPDDARIGLLVWGDPSLYDSTLRILERLRHNISFSLRVIPGITALQALTAAFPMALNTIGGEVLITTGRRLAHGWPARAETVAVMLDGVLAFKGLVGQDLDIWWGAYLGSTDQIVVSGALDAVCDEIVRKRAAARARHGWIMDTYLLRRRRAIVSP